MRFYANHVPLKKILTKLAGFEFLSLSENRRNANFLSIILFRPRISFKTHLNEWFSPWTTYRSLRNSRTSYPYGFPISPPWNKTANRMCVFAQQTNPFRRGPRLGKRSHFALPFFFFLSASIRLSSYVNNMRCVCPKRVRKCITLELSLRTLNSSPANDNFAIPTTITRKRRVYVHTYCSSWTDGSTT